MSHEFALVVMALGFMCAVAAAFLQFGVPAGLMATSVALIISALAIHDEASRRNR